jgi:hypothetical protein
MERKLVWLRAVRHKLHCMLLRLVAKTGARVPLSCLEKPSLEDFAYKGGLVQKKRGPAHKIILVRKAPKSIA